jgi:hypothetical protein
MQMSTNKDLLKQAIAEAKTIREAAIANAKEALEETLTPHLKEMLAQKLQEMEDSDEEEDFGTNAVTGEKLPNPADQMVTEEEEEGEEEETEEGEEEEEVEIEDMSIDDLKDLIRDIVSQEVGHDESEEEAPEGAEDMTGKDSEEEIDINELLAELAEMDGDVEEGEEMVNEEPITLAAGALIAAIGIPSMVASAIGITKLMDLAKAGKFGDKAKGIADKLEKAGSVAGDVTQQKGRAINESENIDENIDIIYQLIEMFPFLTNSTAQMLLGAFGAVGITGFSAIASKVKDMALAGKFGGAAKSFAEKLQAAGGAAGAVTQQRESAELEEYSSGKVDPMSMFSGKETGKELDVQLVNAVKSAAKKVGMSVQDFMKKHILAQPGERSAPKETSWNESAELNEALATVRQLRNQLQEVNLLNAKLLYVNKVFKANNLTEGQKVNVVAAFDKAETVKEVKLVFETVSKNVVTKPATIKEHRSFASKATGNAQTTAPKEIISEVSEQVSRWQKLAGIIK